MLHSNEEYYDVIILHEDSLYVKTGVSLPITRIGWAPVEME
jgi:hypothetical protein